MLNDYWLRRRRHRSENAKRKYPNQKQIYAARLLRDDERVKK